MKPEVRDLPAGSTAAQLVERFAGTVTALPSPPEPPTLQVEPGRLLEVAEEVHRRGFLLCLDVGGVDYFERKPRFEVVYQFIALDRMERLCLRVPVPEEKAEVPSLSHLWPSTQNAEREVYDLFGIRFTGHANLTRIMMPADWEGHPLRKDYPLRGPRAAAAGRGPRPAAPFGS